MVRVAKHRKEFEIIPQLGLVESTIVSGYLKDHEPFYHKSVDTVYTETSRRNSSKHEVSSRFRGERESR